MIFICVRCKAEYQIQANNTTTRHYISHYGDIDKVTGRAYELQCFCGIPLITLHDHLKTIYMTDEDVEEEITDWVREESLRPYPYED